MMPAVSVLSLYFPNETGRNPRPIASAVSPSVKSPSGPINTQFSPVGGTSHNSVRSPSMQWAMYFAPGWSLLIHALNFSRSRITGRYALPDCLIAATATFSILSIRSFLLSDRWQMRGVILVTPISVAFSTKNSNRSMFFVGAMAMCSWYGKG